jgi:hypothetical protein
MKRGDEATNLIFIITIFLKIPSAQPIAAALCSTALSAVPTIFLDGQILRSHLPEQASFSPLNAPSLSRRAKRKAIFLAENSS